MYTLPQLLEEDFNHLTKILVDLVEQSEASMAIITDKAGFRLVEHGLPGAIDTTSLSALASGSFMATQEIAKMIDEPNFSSVYQQGEKHSLFVQNIDEFTVLIVIFPAHISAGAIKYYSAPAIISIAQQLAIAKGRAPGSGIDLAMLNIADTPDFFKKKNEG